MSCHCPDQDTARLMDSLTDADVPLRPMSCENKEGAMMRIAYCFALHKWRRHVLLKDKMPDEKENSFHVSYFVAELLSVVWLNLSQKMIRKGRGIINHGVFSLSPGKEAELLILQLAGLPSSRAWGLFHYSDLQITRAALCQRRVKLHGFKWETAVKDPFHLCSTAVMTKQHQEFWACKIFTWSQEVQQEFWKSPYCPRKEKRKSFAQEREMESC